MRLNNYLNEAKEKEVMIKCKYSYLCRYELIEPLNEALDLNWQYPKMGFRKI